MIDPPPPTKMPTPPVSLTPYQHNDQTHTHTNSRTTLENPHQKPPKQPRGGRGTPQVLGHQLTPPPPRGPPANG